VYKVTKERTSAYYPVNLLSTPFQNWTIGQVPLPQHPAGTHDGRSSRHRQGKCYTVLFL
jgi:hypothetical protein